jgi:DNA-binding protein HU-beta
MTKAELIALLAEKSGDPQPRARLYLETLEGIYENALRQDGEALLPGLGKLVVVERAARVGRNPKTGEAIQVPPMKVVKFKAIKGLREMLNGMN